MKNILRMDMHKIIKEMTKLIQDIGRKLQFLKNGYSWNGIESITNIHP